MSSNELGERSIEKLNFTVTPETVDEKVSLKISLMLTSGFL
jgi:hypothetical protein